MSSLEFADTAAISNGTHGGGLASGVYLLTPERVSALSASLPTALGQATPTQPSGMTAETEAVARALENASALHSLQGALEVGEIVFRRIFSGDERLLRARGKKNSSFRKLAAHPELGMSPSSLWRAVAIYELSRRFPELCQYMHTGVGHISVVLGLPEADQYSLLRATESQRWTRRRLQKEAAQLRCLRREGSSMPRARFLDRLAGLELLTHDTCRDDVTSLQREELQEALNALSRVRQRLAEFEDKLQLQPAE